MDLTRAERLRKQKKIKRELTRKQILGIIIPSLIVAGLLIFLTNFRDVETLGPEEIKAIEAYKQKLVQGTLVDKSEGLFTQADFNTIMKSMERLHEYANFLVFGPEWGYKINNTNQEFAKVEAIINKPEYSKTPDGREFIQSLKDDIALAKKNFGKRDSHDILDDLASLVFVEHILDGERQWGNPKTVQLMKKKGIKLVKEQPSNTENAPQTK
ncbi:hypothetical protein [Thermoflavimicrobium daqui]|uniref:Uncharacterized protein n=1 Tax=Thermoflavimicrobium daqui TaxID=2137476 RepID=A0A364K890_9BACL|nr:hypothetical protein [Thermoflavimicrobium daqui]RAL26513.1 hypothetical protein DL897_00190 [Thermoflavimicrobium daqui]